MKILFEIHIRESKGSIGPVNRRGRVHLVVDPHFTIDDPVTKGFDVIGSKKGFMQIIQEERTIPCLTGIIGYGTIYISSNAKEGFFKLTEKVEMIPPGPGFHVQQLSHR